MFCPPSVCMILHVSFLIRLALICHWCFNMLLLNVPGPCVKQPVALKYPGLNVVIRINKWINKEINRINVVRGIRFVYALPFCISDIKIMVWHTIGIKMLYVAFTHSGRIKLTITGSDNGSSPGRRQAIIWTNAGILIIGPLCTNFSEIAIVIQTFSLK